MNILKLQLKVYLVPKKGGHFASPPITPALHLLSVRGLTLPGYKGLVGGGTSFPEPHCPLNLSLFAVWTCVMIMYEDVCVRM